MNLKSYAIQHQNAIPGPDDITRVQLPNGITVLSRPNFNSVTVTLTGFLQVGSLFDTDEKLGTSDFTASALMRGTSQRDFQTLYNDLESAGASFGFNGATHTTSFSGKALAEDLPLLLGILSETLRSPNFPKEQVARLKAQLMTGLAIRAQSTSDMASLTFEQLVYKDHPYGRPEDGFPETVSHIERHDLVEFHDRHYGPKGMVVCVVGGIEPDKAVEMVSDVLGDWDNPHQPDPPELPELTPLNEIVRGKVALEAKSQSDIVIGVAGPPRNHPAYIPAAVGNNVLGQFGMMGRIGTSVREQAGLAYYAYSSLSGGVGPGPWSVIAGVNPANVDQTVELIRQEIRRFVTEEIEAEELSDTKANFIGRMPLALESNAGVAMALLNLERYELPLDYYINYADRINAVTPGQILEVAREFLHPDRLVVAVAGP